MFSIVVLLLHLGIVLPLQISISLNVLPPRWGSSEALVRACGVSQGCKVIGLYAVPTS